MEITIGDPIKPEVHKNEYKVVVKFMYGDADGYGSEEIFIDKDDPILERFINFLNDCEKAYPSGRSGYDNYDSDIVPDYWLFAEDDKELNDEEEALRKTSDIYLYWHYDPSGDGIMASFNGYKITFFDAHGIEHKVIITK
jgi:hypothetical protein